MCGVLAAYAHLPGAAKVSPPGAGLARYALLHLRGQVWNPLVSSDPVPLGRRPRSKRSGNCPPSGQAWAHFCLLFVWPPSGESGPQAQGPASPLPFPVPGPHAPRAARGPVGGGPAGPVAVCSFGVPGSSRPGPHGTACPRLAPLPGARGDTGTVGGEEGRRRPRGRGPRPPAALPAHTSWDVADAPPGPPGPSACLWSRSSDMTGGRKRGQGPLCPAGSRSREPGPTLPLVPSAPTPREAALRHGAVAMGIVY